MARKAASSSAGGGAAEGTRSPGSASFMRTPSEFAGRNHAAPAASKQRQFMRFGVILAKRESEMIQQETRERTGTVMPARDGERSAWRLAPWLAQVGVALILAQTLFFKFT